MYYYRADVIVSGIVVIVVVVVVDVVAFCVSRVLNNYLLHRLQILHTYSRFGSGDLIKIWNLYL